MARKAPSSEVLKLLLVRSGNECAFPECEHPIFNDKGLYVAQLCHIRAANRGGQRFDEAQTSEDRCKAENLIFMCYRHHKETDDESEYSVEKLQEMKANHESKYTEYGKAVSKELIRQVRFESDYYWKQQSIKKFEFSDFKIERVFDKEILDLFTELDEHIEVIKDYCDLCAKTDSSETLRADLQVLLEKSGLDLSSFDKIPYNENPFENRNWEMHNIGRPNLFSHVLMCISQLKVKTLEELQKREPENEKLKDLIESFRADFESRYDDSYYID